MKKNFDKWLVVLLAVAVFTGLALFEFFPPRNTKTSEKVGFPEHLERLVAEQSVSALAKLLAANGEPLPEGTLSISRPERAQSSLVQQVEGVQRITSGGLEYVVAMVRQEVETSASPMPSKSQLGYLFDTNGRFLRRFGTLANSKSPGGTIMAIRTLGSNHYWFVFESCPVKSPDGLQMELNLFLLDDMFPKAMQVQYHTNSLVYTGTPERAKKGIFMWFLLPENKIEISDAGTGANGKPYPPVVRWNEKDRVFYGPSQVTIDGRLVYKVNIGESKRFRPTDLE